jgi:hypothetical protein
MLVIRHTPPSRANNLFAVINRGIFKIKTDARLFRLIPTSAFIPGRAGLVRAKCNIIIHSSPSNIIVIISAPHIYTASTNAVRAISISAAAVDRILIY